LGPRRIENSPVELAPPVRPVPSRQRSAVSPAGSAAATRQPPAAEKKRVLFVCIGNSCRSQMAEGFAKTYGGDVIAASSAGLSPATMIAPLTRQILEERNVFIDHHYPKGLDVAARERVDLLVNMSGRPLSLPGVPVVEWRVRDPIGLEDTVYREVATQIETLVMRLILDLRNAARQH
jgi:arsenate reductase (thioredoxin)